MISDLFKIRHDNRSYLIKLNGDANVYDLIEFMCYLLSMRYSDKLLLRSSSLMKVIYEIGCVINRNGYFSMSDRYGSAYVMELLGIKSKVLLNRYLNCLVKYGFLERIRVGIYRINQEYFMCNCKFPYKFNILFSNISLKL